MKKIFILLPLTFFLNGCGSYLSGMAGYSLFRNYISGEVMKCELGEENILEGYRPCAGFNKDGLGNAQINAMISSYGDVIFANFSNPYTGVKNCQTSTTYCMIKGENN
mgnify:CR=1 FL=1